MANLLQAPIPVPGPSGTQSINRMTGDETQGAGTLPGGGVTLWGVDPSRVKDESVSDFMLPPDSSAQVEVVGATEIAVPEIALPVTTEQVQPIPKAGEVPKIIVSTSPGKIADTTMPTSVAQGEVHQPVESVLTFGSNKDPFEQTDNNNDKPIDFGSIESLLGADADKSIKSVVK